MEFPPLDDDRWDRLLRAVIGQRPTVGDPAAPLATPFPTQGAAGEAEADATKATDATEEPHLTIDLDADAYVTAGGATEVPSGRRSSASS